jgi:hypothetical protein
LAIKFTLNNFFKYDVRCQWSAMLMTDAQREEHVTIGRLSVGECEEKRENWIYINGQNSICK